MDLEGIKREVVILGLPGLQVNAGHPGYLRVCCNVLGEIGLVVSPHLEDLSVGHRQVGFEHGIDVANLEVLHFLDRVLVFGPQLVPMGEPIFHALLVVGKALVAEEQSQLV